MTPDVQQIVEHCSRASDEERITFPQVVGALLEAGVERYHADLLRDERVFYMPDGSSHRVDVDSSHGLMAAEAFDDAAVESAIRAIQQGTIQYVEFCRRIAAAGCVGYIVSLAGRRAVYYGRSGETFVEPFPQAA